MPTLEDITAHNSSFLVQKNRLRSYSNESATIVVGAPEGWHQVAQFGFASDGSFHVTWPYLPVSNGVVAEVRFPDQASGPVKIDLNALGKFTAQRVKYSHHTSGIAQYSLTGKVRNDIRRQSFPLTGPIGQLFQLQCHGLSRFKALTRLKPRRVYIPFFSPDGLPPAMMIRGGWHRKTDILSNTESKTAIGPIAPFLHRRSGEEGRMVFFSPPLQCPVAQRMLSLIGNPVPMPDGGDERGGLVLIAGLDPHEKKFGTPSAPIGGGLAALYPINDPKDMQRRLGTIDLEPL